MTLKHQTGLKRLKLRELKQTLRLAFLSFQQSIVTQKYPWGRTQPAAAAYLKSHICINHARRTCFVTRNDAWESRCTVPTREEDFANRRPAGLHTCAPLVGRNVSELQSVPIKRIEGFGSGLGLRKYAIQQGRAGGTGLSRPGDAAARSGSSPVPPQLPCWIAVLTCNSETLSGQKIVFVCSDFTEQEAVRVSQTEVIS